MRRTTVCGLSALIALAMVLGGCAAESVGTKTSPSGENSAPHYDGPPYGS